MIRYITEQEAIAFNHFAIERLSPNEQAGVKDANALNSAIMRPQQSLFGDDAYPTIHTKAAALVESLSQNHPFHNANKRTAFLCMYQFYFYNGYELVMDQKFAEDFIVDIVNHAYSFNAMSHTLEEYTKQV